MNRYQTINIEDYIGDDKKFEDKTFSSNNSSLGNEPYASQVHWERP